MKLKTPKSAEITETSKTILVIDDETAFLLAMKKLLQGPSIKIVTAETIEDATSLLDQIRFDAVIADIRLTGVLRNEGIMILKYVKDAYKDTGVIMITGFGNPEVMEDAYRLGADFYFEKPVSINILKGALRDLGVLT